MNCTEFTALVDDYVDSDLEPALHADFDLHRASCEVCQKELMATKALIASLHMMPVVDHSDGFVDRVISVAISSDAQKTHQKNGFMVGFGSAAAAALALWIGFGWAPDEQPGSEPMVSLSEPMASLPTHEVVNKQIAKKSTQNTPVLSIALNTQRDITLAFFSGEELEGATITIHIPEHVALVGFPGQRQLSWKTNLSKGDNTLRLPILATKIANGELIAHIEFAGQIKTLKVRIETSASDMTRSIDWIESLA